MEAGGLDVVEREGGGLRRRQVQREGHVSRVGRTHQSFVRHGGAEHDVRTARSRAPFRPAQNVERKRKVGW